MADRTEPGEIPVEGHHVAVMLEGDGREHGVGDQVARRVGLVAQSPQQGEVSWPRARRKVVGLRQAAGQTRGGPFRDSDGHFGGQPEAR